MERTLVNTWSAQPKRGLQPSLVQHALQKLRERIARHQSAWSDGDGAAAGAAGGSRQRAGSAGPLSEPALRPLLQRVGLQDVPVLAYVNIKASCDTVLRIGRCELCCRVPTPFAYLPQHTGPSPALPAAGWQQGDADAQVAGAGCMARLLAAAAADWGGAGAA